MKNATLTVTNAPTFSRTWLEWHWALYANPIFSKRHSARARGPLAPGAAYLPEGK